MRDNFAPVFVVGHPRSGTTLLAAILGRHSRIAATPETQFLTYGRYPVERALARGPAAVAEACARTRLGTLRLDREALARRLSGCAELTVEAVFRVVLEAYAAQHGKALVVEKTPTHVRYVELLHAWYPGARFIWIVRDGRACVASLRKLEWASHNLYHLAWQWLRNTAFGLRAESACGAAVRRVRYEDLVRDPERMVRDLDAWIGVDFEPAQLDPSVGTNVMTAAESSWKRQILQPILPNRAEAWREDLRPAELALLDGLMGPGLQRLGYAATSRDAVAQPMRRAVAYAMSLSCKAPSLAAHSAIEAAVKRIRVAVGA